MLSLFYLVESYVEKTTTYKPSWKIETMNHACLKMPLKDICFLDLGYHLVVTRVEDMDARMRMKSVCN